MKARSLVYFFACASLLVLGALAWAAPPAGSYHLVKKILLGAAPGGGEYFDYVTFDAPTRRVYLTHGTEVKVVDADSYKVVGTISSLQRCHGVVILRDLGKGFVTDGDGHKVVIFDPKTFKITGEVKTPPGTDSIIYDPATKLLITFNGDSKNATVIDPVKEAAVKTIDLVGQPEFPAGDGKGMIYDNNEEKNDIVAIDLRTLTIKARWPVAPAGLPVAMAMDREHGRLFSGTRGPQMMLIINPDSGKIIQSFPISAVVDANVFDPQTGMLYASTREGKVHIFHEDTPDKFSEVETVTTEYGAKTMALDPKTKRMFLTTSDFGPAPAPTKEHPNPQRPAIPGTARLLVYGR